MNVPRYWRKYSQRYRLIGVQYTNGQKSIVNRPQQIKSTESKANKEHSTLKVSLA
jgi:hypothetical protein